MDGRVRGGLGCTIENCADEESGEIGLLLKVQGVRDIWSVRIGRPRFLRVRHSPNVYEEGFRRGAGLKVGEGIPRPQCTMGEKRLRIIRSLAGGVVGGLSFRLKWWTDQRGRIIAGS